VVYLPSSLCRFKRKQTIVLESCQLLQYGSPSRRITTCGRLLQYQPDLLSPVPRVIYYYVLLILSVALFRTEPEITGHLQVLCLTLQLVAPCCHRYLARLHTTATTTDKKSNVFLRPDTLGLWILEVGPFSRAMQQRIPNRRDLRPQIRLQHHPRVRQLQAMQGHREEAAQVPQIV
jgi:hypothetical protein